MLYKFIMQVNYIKKYFVFMFAFFVTVCDLLYQAFFSCVGSSSSRGKSACLCVC